MAPLQSGTTRFLESPGTPPFDRKVIGVGYNKTGTTTLGTCLEMLGSERHTSISRDALLLHYVGERDAVLRLMDYYTSFEDWPWPLLFREAYARFPDARFVLTTRADEDTWFKSLASHAERGKLRGKPNIRRYVYGHDNPWEDRDHHIAAYRAHNEAVRAFFADKPDSLLEVCWERGDGWGELCGFLGVPVPDVPFPHLNRKPPPPGSNPQKSIAQAFRKARNLFNRGRTSQVLTRAARTLRSPAFPRSMATPLCQPCSPGHP